MTALDAAALHDVLRDPALDSVGFLNEIMTRYPDAISFAPGAPNPDLLPGREIARCVHRFRRHLLDRGLSAEQAGRLLLEYGPSRGIINDIVAAALRGQGIDVPPGAVVITVGAQEAMLLVLRALFRPGREVLAVANPSFVGLLGAARLLDITMVAVAEAAGGIDLAGLRTACRAGRAAGQPVRAIFVAPDYSNPGGGLMSADCRRGLLALAEQEDLLVIEDNTYGFTAQSPQPSLKALDAGQRVIHIGTFAKIAFPGARVGYVVADQPCGERILADHLAALKGMVTVNTPPLCQAVIGGMLLERGGSLSALSAPRAQLYRRNLRCLLDALDRQAGGLPGISWNRPAGGFFVRVRVPAAADAALLEVSAARHGVLWTPMAPFYLGDAGDRQLRLSCSYLNPPQIEEGVRRLAAFIRDELVSFS